MPKERRLATADAGLLSFPLALKWVVSLHRILDLVHSLHIAKQGQLARCGEKRLVVLAQLKAELERLAVLARLAALGRLALLEMPESLAPQKVTFLAICLLRRDAQGINCLRIYSI